MFSNFYHLGNTIELFNLQNKNLCSKWHFEGKYSKVFDPSLKCYEMILSTGNLSKMLIPKVKKKFKNKNTVNISRLCCFSIISIYKQAIFYRIGHIRYYQCQTSFNFFIQ